MTGPVAALLDEGERLHLQHGPIDLIIGADSVLPGGRERAFAAAAARLDGLLEALVAELPLLRAPLRPDAQEPVGPVARRMHAAALPYCADIFLTCMAAVAGAVADEILSAMTAAEPLRRAYVNNGGDIAIHLSGATRFTTAMVALDGRALGRIALTGADGVGGMATSGAGGRSHSFGIADSVTVLAASAAEADVAATLIANAVDLPGHPAICRSPASELQPDSDLGDRLIVTEVGSLCAADIRDALSSGAAEATRLLRDRRIAGAALFLQGEQMLTGTYFGQDAQLGKVDHVEV
ncbi:MAG: UPF0280 family protein [Pseudorhodobacter sp.]